MTIQRMDNVGIVVDDLEAAVAFFVELGMEPDGKASIEGLWVDRAVGLGELAHCEESYRLCYVRGPEGIIVGLA
ncbi:MAG: hypothetical protein ACRDVD_09800 [Acidimicrobiia bacterium]